MKYTVEKAEKSTVKITVELTAKEWDEQIEVAYQKTKNKFSLPGFRKGKTPRNLIEGSYGKGVFYETALDESVNKYLWEVVDKEKIEIVGRPDLEVKDISDKGASFIAKAPVYPEVKLGEYKGITFKKVEYNVTDKDIEEELKRLQERNSRLVEVKDREVKKGDTAVIDFLGTVDGVAFEGGKADNYSLEIGSGSFIPGFEDQVVGMKIDESKDVKVKFPDDYFEEKLKGKDANFAVKLHAIKVKELPEITDEFVKDAVGAESVEAYKKETQARLEKQNADRADIELENEIAKEITARAKVEIPEAMIESEIDRKVQEFGYRLSYQGIDLNYYLQMTGKKMEEFRAEQKEGAEEAVKTQIVLRKLIEEEKIDATEDDLKAKIEEMAKAQGKKVPDVKKSIQDRQLDYLKNEIVIKKLFDFLKAENTIK